MKRGILSQHKTAICEARTPDPGTDSDDIPLGKMVSLYERIPQREMMFNPKKNTISIQLNPLTMHNNIMFALEIASEHDGKAFLPGYPLLSWGRETFPQVGSFRRPPPFFAEFCNGSRSFPHDAWWCHVGTGVERSCGCKGSGESRENRSLAGHAENRDSRKIRIWT